MSDDFIEAAALLAVMVEDHEKAKELLRQLSRRSLRELHTSASIYKAMIYDIIYEKRKEEEGNE